MCYLILLVQLTRIVETDNQPDRGREGDDWEEHAVQVEVFEEPTNPDPIDGEGDLWNSQIQGTAHHISLLEGQAGTTHLSRLATCTDVSSGTGHEMEMKTTVKRISAAISPNLSTQLLTKQSHTHTHTCIHAHAHTHTHHTHHTYCQ